MSKKDTETIRHLRVRQLFQVRHPDKPTTTDVLIFFGWLEKHHPELLPKEKLGDQYDHLKVDLSGLYK